MKIRLNEDGRYVDCAADQQLPPPCEVDARALFVSHLTPYVLTVLLPQGDEVKVRVDFSSHCYTETYNPGAVNSDLVLINDSGRMRVFSKQRFDLFRMLPNIIENLHNQKILMTPPKPRLIPNYVTLGQSMDLGNNMVYHVYFVMRTQSGRLNGVRYKIGLFVESAYATHKKAQGMPIKFGVLIGKTLKKEIIRYKNT